MSGWRASAAWTKETSFGSGIPSGATMMPFGTGLTSFTYNLANSASYVYGLGSKTWQDYLSGRVKGTWSASFLLDYSNFAWLGTILENYDFNTATKVHTFSKSSGSAIKALPSLAIRATRLNAIAGGGSDQQAVLSGCIASSATLNYESSSGSSVRVTLSGVFANVAYTLNDSGQYTLDTNLGNPSNPVSWGCVQTLSNATAIPGTPIANTEKVSITIANSVQTVPTCGSRIDSAFREGSTNITGSTTVYGNDFTKWLGRVNSGGSDNSMLSPAVKSLNPVPFLGIVSFDSDTWASGTTPANYCAVVLSNSIVESANSQFNVGSELVDSPTFNAQNVSISILSSVQQTKYTIFS